MEEASHVDLMRLKMCNDLKACEESVYETYGDHTVYGARLLRHPSSHATTVSPIMSPVHHHMSQSRGFKGDVVTLSPTVSYGASPSNSRHGSPMSLLDETPVPLSSSEDDVTFTNVTTPITDLQAKEQDLMKDNFLVASFNGPQETLSTQRNGEKRMRRSERTLVRRYFLHGEVLAFPRRTGQLLLFL